MTEAPAGEADTNDKTPDPQRPGRGVPAGQQTGTVVSDQTGHPATGDGRSPRSFERLILGPGPWATTRPEAWPTQSCHVPGPIPSSLCSSYNPNIVLLPRPTPTSLVPGPPVGATPSCLLTEDPLPPQPKRCPGLGRKGSVPKLETWPHSIPPLLLPVVLGAKQEATCGKTKQSPPKGVTSSPSRQSPAPKGLPSPSAKSRVSKSSPRASQRRKAACLPPLSIFEIVEDKNEHRWKLLKLVSQGDNGMFYEAQSVSGAYSQKEQFSLKLDSKDSRLYNEQNFLQRAAQKTAVAKWKKLHLVPLLGIPHCVGLGLHEGKYRFLVFPSLGRSLQSAMEDLGSPVLTEKTAYQVSCRLVTLAGYYYAYRYCPGGRHVRYQEGSRTPHEGTVEFISLDAHKGVGPSRRSDLENLGYCLLKWLSGLLPWSSQLENAPVVMGQKERFRTNVPGLLKGCFCQKAFSDSLQLFLESVMGLQYEEKPNYSLLRETLGTPLKKLRASAYDPVDLHMVP
uniref:VRK serine/threonine kinase 3 n=1 Tax=Ornithorhynchus anatinus TaxID=9258 RepID=A0A6I8P1Z0_ORNAN